MLLFGTTNTDSTHHNDDKRAVPKGYGHDKCVTHKPPSLETFGDIINAKNIRKIMGLVSSFNDSENTACHFRSYFFRLLKEIEALSKYLNALLTEFPMIGGISIYLMDPQSKSLHQSFSPDF